ncbi:FAD/NAD(P)-binding domain-containing protein [Sarocladium strictum]
MRCLPGSINIPVARFPASSKSATPANATEVAEATINNLNDALGSSDAPQRLASLFIEDGYWRDHLALSWRFRTAHSPSKIADLVKISSDSRDGLRLKKFSLNTANAARAPKIVPIDAEGQSSGVQLFVDVETSVGAGTGLIRVVQEGQEWKIFTLYTKLEELRGFEEARGSSRPKGVEHGGKPGRKNWAERRALASNFEDGTEPTVLVIGGGQAGLTAAARLKMLGVDTLVVDQNERTGDNWRKRYHQLVLHDPVWYDHLPYLNFPSYWPIFTPKDKLAEFFEAYAKLLELNIWNRTEIVHTSWSEQEQRWTVILNRVRADGTSEIRKFYPRHVVQATGHSGKKNMPAMQGIESFEGDRLCHSSEFAGAKENSKGKKAVVVGSCNSAHDIAQDFLEKGYDITIVQRSTTHVVSSEAIVDIGLKGLYSEDGPPVDDADLMLHGLPTSVLKALQIQIAERQAEHDKELLEGLDRAGFKVDRGPDGAGLFMKYFQRGGGYYINVGASQLIAAGKIKVKQGQEISTVLPHGLRFEDGSELEADEIVFATGYQNMRTQTRTIFGDSVADKVGDVWGFNEEGEMRVMWQESGHPGFWFHGGNLAICRYYSKLLALQIKAQEEGLYKRGDI